MNFDPTKLIRRHRRPIGMSAILLPFQANGKIDWQAFCGHVKRTQAAGLVPAVNMDTGYANLIDEPTRIAALDATRSVLDGAMFVAGAFVGDRPEDRFNRDAYLRGIEDILEHGGMPIVFQCYGLCGLGSDELVDAYRAFAELAPKFLAFELGQMFAPFGRIYSLEIYRELLKIPQCVGAKHSSLHREPEWQRILLRDQERPDFMVLTGNDLAIDMIMYGSDYLLGLSTFAPDAFAKRDALWSAGDPAFYELNDLLQYLGFFAFRDPVPAYKHNAAQFHELRGWLSCDATHPRSPARPESDREVLQDIVRRLNEWQLS